MDKKNTLLLTVIAIATLLVAVIGATFAYFTAQAGAGANANVNVTTSTTDTATFGTFNNIEIDANLQNFYKDAGSLRDTTTGFVGFTASDASDQTANYCYTVDLELTNNTFIYSLPKTRTESKNYPELVLTIWKKAAQTDSDASKIDEDGNMYTIPLITPKEEDGNVTIPYETNIFAGTANSATDTTLCLVDEMTPEAEPSVPRKGCTESQKIQGYDITIFGNTTIKEDATGLKDIKKIQIPIATASSQDVGSYNEADFKHKITATGKAGTMYDLWKVAVTFVNYTDEHINDGTGDQSKYENDENLGNAGRKFNAKLVFTPTPCE